MTGPHAVTLFLPTPEGGFTPLVMQGVHWQEEAFGGGVSAGGAVRAAVRVRVFAPPAAVPAGLPALCGACLAAKGVHTAPFAAPAFTLTAALHHTSGSPALHHWELILE